MTVADSDSCLNVLEFKMKLIYLVFFFGLSAEISLVLSDFFFCGGEQRLMRSAVFPSIKGFLRGIGESSADIFFFGVDPIAKDLFPFVLLALTLAFSSDAFDPKLLETLFALLEKKTTDVPKKIIAY